jgi:uncharacterized membrane protein
LVPGAANRFLTIAEDEVSHRRGIENRQLDIAGSASIESLKIMRRGQTLAFIIAIFGLALSGALAWHGAEIAGTVLGSGSLATIILGFLRSRGAVPPKS